MICCIFLLRCGGSAGSCIGIPSIVGQEDTPQAESLLPVGLGPISHGYVPCTRIGIANPRISGRVIMT